MPTHDFPAVSDGRAGRGGRPGDVRKETLYEYIEGKNWKKGEWGEKIGSVELSHPRGAGEGITVVASFAFDNDETVQYTGPVPGNGTWRGKGRFRFEKGTGKFADPKRRPNLDVDSTNPKRWG